MYLGARKSMFKGEPETAADAFFPHPTAGLLICQKRKKKKRY